MKNKYLIIFLAMLILPLSGLAAQEGSYTFMSFDIGYGVSTPVNNFGVNSLTCFGINFRLAGPMSVGAAYFNAAGSNFGGLKVKFDATSLVRATLTFGGTGAAGVGNLRTGLGFELVPFKRQVSSLFSEFKLSTDYIFAPNAVDAGSIYLSLMLGIGF